MENTIMTEKIARRGVKSPDSYEPDILEKIEVSEVIKESGLVLSEENTIGEVREWLEKEPDYKDNFFIVVSNDNNFLGIISSSNLFSHNHNTGHLVSSLIRRHHISINGGSSLRSAVILMGKENIDMLPVVDEEERKKIIGVLSYKDIIAAYKQSLDEHQRKRPSISLKRQRLKILVRGRQMVETKSKRN